MECITGNPPLLTKAIILLNVFHLFSSVTQKPYKWHIIRFHLFWAFAFIFSHDSEWESKQHNHPSVWLCLVEVRKDRQTNKYVILFPFASQKNKFNVSQKSQESIGIPVEEVCCSEAWHFPPSRHCMSSTVVHSLIVWGGIIFDPVKTINPGIDNVK